MVEVKLCDFCILDGKVCKATRLGSNRSGTRVHICDIHRKEFKSSSISKITEVIEESTFVKMPQLLATPRTINT